MTKIVLIIAAIAALEMTAIADGPTAEDLYSQGQAAYDKADYQTAIAKWQASFDLSGESGLLFNLAQAKRLAGDCAGAFVTYRRFMDADADHGSEQHQLAEDFARELAVTCKPPAPVKPADPQPPLDAGLNLGDRLNSPNDRGPRDRGSGRTMRVAGLVTGGTGIAVIATGLLIGSHAQTLSGEVTDACRTSCDWAAQKDKDAAGRRDATIGRVLDVAGAAAIAGGAVMYYLGVRERGVTVAPKPEGGAVLSWSGSW
jgi:hypothetical protein